MKEQRGVAGPGGIVRKSTPQRFCLRTAANTAQNRKLSPKKTDSVAAGTADLHPSARRLNGLLGTSLRREGGLSL